MSGDFLIESRLPDAVLWERTRGKRVPLSFDLEATARCNNDCRHCYINLPAGDHAAQAAELALDEIVDIAGQAISLGSLWCVLTGGEPLLRQDFADLYVALKRKGLLVGLFTNACLVTKEHVRLFRRYPPRDIEVTVYGVTEETYERVSRRPGSYAAFRRGLDLLSSGGLRVRLKTVALRSNVHELPAITAFCRERTTDFFRFDPLLHLRYDGDAGRNEEIRSERLSPAEIVAVEQADPERAGAMAKNCDNLIFPGSVHEGCTHLFHCGAGRASFSVSYDGHFRLCSSLWHPDTVYDLRRGSLAEAWRDFAPQVRDLRSTRREYLDGCHCCPIVNLCLGCPAHAYLETGEMDGRSAYFCEVAHARAAALQKVTGTFHAGP